MQYWLFKSEPDEFSIDDLRQQKRAPWEGVRNYQARNFMRDQCRKGDIILFYHSSCKPAGVAGLAVVTKEAFDDPAQFDPKSPYYDSKSTPENPRWQCVEVGFKAKFPRLVELSEIKASAGLKDMVLVRKGSRLSIQPVTEKEFQKILKMAGLE